MSGQPQSLTQLFVSACKKLRVLNALRSFEIGMPLSSGKLSLTAHARYAAAAIDFLTPSLISGQYDELTPGVVIDRLLSRRQHRLGLLLCDYLGLPSAEGRDKVLVHWACVKVRRGAGGCYVGGRPTAGSPPPPAGARLLVPHG